MDHRFLYSLNKEDRGQRKLIVGLYFLGAMQHPGGGRNNIPDRLKRMFYSMNIPPPSSRAVEGIYGRILKELLPKKKYSDEIIGMVDPVVEATIGMWETCSKKILPTPTKFHYTFTIRELARVFGGLCSVAGKPEYKVIQNCSNVKEKIMPQLFLIALWRHECDRTFVDKLINNNDKKIFSDMLDRVTKEKFRDSLGFDDEQLMTSYYFADF
jgi:dynein heavy chain